MITQIKLKLTIDDKGQHFPNFDKFELNLQCCQLSAAKEMIKFYPKYAGFMSFYLLVGDSSNRSVNLAKQYLLQSNCDLSEGLKDCKVKSWRQSIWLLLNWNMSCQWLSAVWFNEFKWNYIFWFTSHAWQSSFPLLSFELF